MTTIRKPVFDTVRAILGRGFRQHEVDRLDAALDGHAPTQANSVTCVTFQQVGPQGIALIKRFEGCARLRTDGMVEAYPDPASGGDPWTIGWGATGTGIGPGTVWTQGECDERLARDLERYAREVGRALDGAPTTQAQFDALVSFHYNTGAIARATLTKLHRSGDFCAAKAEFGRWNRAAGRILKGLTRRRAAEAELYASG
ncbi:lysozyme [Erythrobacter sp. HKB08]|uniref:lysozyme n=1 Tax=Erythrobacter sp. HKB08 TaxID=2502843 RepID=UPI001008AD5D|nr:lysozyme [Erythrobacter sp. HKB08]